MLQIWRKLKQWWNPAPAPVSRPRRVKNYASYQYHLDKSTPGDYQFVIWASGHAARTMRIQVPLPSLSPRDRYALAKLHLFRAFDEHSPADLPFTMEVTDTSALDEL